jgi:signal transduction histidine kinase
MNLFQNSLNSRSSANLVSLLNQRSAPATPAAPDERGTRLQEIGTQAAKIAHDLNNLLSPIIMALDMVRPHLRNESHRAMMEIARKATLRATDLVRQILSSASGAETRRTQIDPGAVVQEVAAFVKTTFPSSLDIQVDAAHDLAPVVANATQLHRALLNLCVNARDAMPEGGALTLRASNVELDHRVMGASRYVLFEVSDTGSGIPEEIRERIFDPYFTTKGPDKGTGLGLDSVRSIVERHAGMLNLQTKIGHGTTFRILIPAAAAQPVSGSLRR